MKAQPSRTINPLHFEDLDPHRFEDLIRQLVYQWRSWTVLEALGKSGADGGVDIRGVERASRPAPTEDDEAEEWLRTWFVQCKREASFGPAKSVAAVAAALDGVTDVPHGFLLVASCDLSRRTRDALASEARQRGVAEVVVWGRSELEDLLYLPQNDHLLFAYFGLSLVVRRTSLATDLRRRLATKRRWYTSVGGLSHDGDQAVLVRDPTVDGYPFEDRVADFDSSDPPWQATLFTAHSNPDAVALVIRRHHAWLSASRKRDCRARG